MVGAFVIGWTVTMLVQVAILWFLWTAWRTREKALADITRARIQTETACGQAKDMMHAAKELAATAKDLLDKVRLLIRSQGGIIEVGLGENKRLPGVK